MLCITAATAAAAAKARFYIDPRRSHPSLMTAGATRQPRLPLLSQQVFNERLC